MTGNFNVEKMCNTIERKDSCDYSIEIVTLPLNKCIFFSLYIQFTLFRTKNLQSPGTYISKRTWDPSQKAITK